MKEFEPSRDFVSRVMTTILAHERAVQERRARSQLPLSSTIIRYVISAGGALLGVANLIRLYGAVFSPALCR